MDVEVKETLDCKGLSCPMPIVKLAKEMKKMNKGEVLMMLGTDPGSKEDVPAWCQRTGHEFLGIEEKQGYNEFYVRCTK